MNYANQRLMPSHYIVQLLPFVNITGRKYTKTPAGGFDVATSQQSQDIHPMLFHCWATGEDGGPTLKQHRVNVSCLLGWTSEALDHVYG